MRGLRNSWRFLLTEPFAWLFLYLFQPTMFRNRFEGSDLIQRFFIMLRLSFPLFLCCFPVTLATRMILNFLLPRFYVYPFANGPLRFLLDTLWSTALGSFSSIVGIIIINTTSN